MGNYSAVRFQLQNIMMAGIAWIQTPLKRTWEMMDGKNKLNDSIVSGNSDSHYVFLEIVGTKRDLWSSEWLVFDTIERPCDLVDEYIPPLNWQSHYKMYWKENITLFPQEKIVNDDKIWFQKIHEFSLPKIDH